MAERPNILFLLPDQHRGDWLPRNPKQAEGRPYEVPLNMPTLNRLMDEGFVFCNATTPSPLCAPARACLAQGNPYQDCKVPTNAEDYPVGERSFYNVLKDGGYHVMACGKLDLHKGSKFWGENGWVESLGEIGFTEACDNEGKIDCVIGEIKFTPALAGGKVTAPLDVSKPENCKRGPYIKHLNSKNMAKYHVDDMFWRNTHKRDIELTQLSDEDYCDNWLTQRGLDLLRNVPQGEPWFMQVNFTGPHDPWDVTASMLKRVQGRKFDAPLRGERQYEEVDKQIRARYTAMLENIDDNIQLLLDEIERRGELENTVVIYASDHGEMLGEFGKYGKCVPEKGSIKVPMILWGKNIRNGSSSALVQLQDLAATITALCGLEETFGDSHDMTRIISGKADSIRPYQVSQLNQWACINDTRYKLVVKPEKTSLYDMQEDPDELKDIAPEHPEIVSALQKALADYKTR